MGANQSGKKYLNEKEKEGYIILDNVTALRIQNVVLDLRQISK